jgi:hypothetical protein
VKREKIRTVGDRGANPFARFADRGVGQTDDDDRRRSISLAFDGLEIYFDVNNKSVNSINGGRLGKEEHFCYLDAIARARRRDEALEALEFEQERERALHDQIGATVHEAERDRIDRDAFSRMAAGDAELVREILGGDEPAEESEADADWEELLADVAAEAPEDDEPSLDEIERLRGEIESSRARQRALERFVEALENSGAERDVGS